MKILAARRLAVRTADESTAPTTESAPRNLLPQKKPPMIHPAINADGAAKAVSSTGDTVLDMNAVIINKRKSPEKSIIKKAFGAVS